MTSRILIPAFLTASLALSFAEDQVGYNADVRPILSDKCFLCHGPDVKKNKAGLRLDTEEGAYAALKDTPGKHAIVAGSLEKSEAWLRITSDDPDEVMPTPKSNLKLTEAEKDIIARWIKQGANYEPHWSFVPLPDEIKVPKIKDPKWARNPIDHFVAIKLEEHSLSPSPEADPIRLFRRVCLDLTGLSPTLDQIKKFQADYKADPETAYEKAVNRLINTIEYAEHMALDWLDTARYADTWGYHSDMNFTAWPYRDWVVRAYNKDLPYDQFLTWNLAGDLLPNATREQRLATAYNRLNRMTNEGGSNPLEFRIDGVSDRVNTVGTALLGLTMECAKCHDHKYDPITAKDYFQISAFFNSISETGLYIHENISPPPNVLLPTEQQEKKYTRLLKAAADLEAKLAKIKAESQPAFQEWKANLQDNTPISIADQTSYFDFNKSHEKPLESLAPSTRKTKDGKPNPFRASVKGGAKYTEGPSGRGTALALNGDEGAEMPHLFHKDRYHPFSLGLWIKDTLRAERSVVIAHRNFGTEIGYHGVDLRIENGYLSARVFRAWPDVGIGIRSVKQLSQNEWHHITWTYDGLSKANGLTLYLNGEPLETKITSDKLYKSVAKKTYTNGHFTLGAIFRGPGFKGGHVDELTTFNRALTPPEVRHIAGAKVPLNELADEELYPYFLANFHEEYRKATIAVSEAHKAVVLHEDRFIEVPVMEEMDAPRPTHILKRGAFDDPGELVQRDSPSFLIPFPEGAPRNRLGFAQWLTLPNHPLTSRVYVNRIWQQFFGQGIVTTAENFGLQGELPSHPELLDWLSRDLINHKWSTKHLVKRIVLSATYRQQSAFTPELQSMDIKNKLLARGPSHRLSGEQIRDSALRSSGLLSNKRGGKPVRPYDPLYNTKPHKDHMHLRSLYSYWRRTKPQSNMIIFDKPSLEVCSVKRSRTNSPAQALVLLNDPQFVEAARHLAITVLQNHKDHDTRFNIAWKRVTTLELGDYGRSILSETFAEQKEYFTNNPESAKKFLKIKTKPLPEGLDIIEAAAMAVTCQTIYNTDAAVWKR